MSVDWEPFIGSAAAAQVENNYGSYSVLDNTTRLRIISVNTNLWYKVSEPPLLFAGSTLANFLAISTYHGKVILVVCRPGWSRSWKSQKKLEKEFGSSDICQWDYLTASTIRVNTLIKLCKGLKLSSQPYSSGIHIKISSKLLIQTIRLSSLINTQNFMV